ncbi:hypothetical protein SAMN04488096_105170 [Mesonia phycicola]|uniref:Cell division protein ZapB n=1 Tax=Mesonia phycicola TaxID=579105 RepID=A0A1M6ENL7_9FLAO|nr:hypothetical protein [Mesonia phycicola]SHI86860.1 hypothetical protein SAMN04488096_105170 [Mesonia phycicola]
MSEKKKESILKILIIVLLAGLLVMVTYTFNFHREKNENIKYLEEEKSYLKSELSQIQTAYDSLNVDNVSIKKSLEKEKKRIATLLDSIKTLETNYGQLKKYRLQADQLKMEKQRLLNHISILAEENKNLKTAIDSTNQILLSAKQKSDSLNLKNEELQKKIDEASIIKISDIVGEGVYLKNNGEVVSTKRLKQIENIRLCFEVNESKIVPEGEKNLYIQVINPNNNLIGERKKESFNDKELYYSVKTLISYHQINLNVCALIHLEESQTVKGKYIVHIFDNDKLLSSASFLIE